MTENNPNHPQIIDFQERKDIKDMLDRYSQYVKQDDETIEELFPQHRRTRVFAELTDQIEGKPLGTTLWEDALRGDKNAIEALRHTPREQASHEET